MVIAEINTLPVGSTGKIMFDLAETARRHGHTVYTYSAKTFRRGMKNDYPERPCHTYFGSEIGNFFHKAVGGVTGFNGYLSTWSTRKLIKQFEKQRIDILHLHNLHEFCINLPMLFGWIKKKNIRVIWTLHDCWAFTGHCPYFTMVGCDKWKSGCGGCPQKNIYPKSYLDTTSFMWKKKKEWFTGVKDLTIVTPSAWLAGLVKESFLSEYPIRVINNGIDLNVFKPTPSDFRETHGIVGGVLLLGVAFSWSKYKGLDVFIELAKRLPENYRIVMVGTNDTVEAMLPDHVITIRKTSNQVELAEIYTAADILLNPTREDNFPTVNIESLACGTPVLTFETNGSPEIIDDSCGQVVPYSDTDAMEQAVYQMIGTYSPDACIKRAKRFARVDRYEEYIQLYERKVSRIHDSWSSLRMGEEERI